MFKALEQAKAKCMEELEDTATSKCTLPFLDEQLSAARELMGHDFWSYGLGANRKVLETFLRHHHSEGLVATAGDAGGDVPSLDARDVYDLKFGRCIRASAHGASDGAPQTLDRREFRMWNGPGSAVHRYARPRPGHKSLFFRRSFRAAQHRRLRTAE